jgi:hypothetical protein
VRVRALAVAVVVVAAVAVMSCGGDGGDGTDGDGGSRLAAVLGVDPGVVASDGTLGEAGLRAMLSPEVGSGIAADGAGGYGRDAVQLVDIGGRTCARIRFEMATTRDNLELNEALSLWVESRPDDAAVEAASTDGVTLRVCGQTTVE